MPNGAFQLYHFYIFCTRFYAYKNIFHVRYQNHMKVVFMNVIIKLKNFSSFYRRIWTSNAWKMSQKRLMDVLKHRVVFTFCVYGELFPIERFFDVAFFKARTKIVFLSKLWHIIKRDQIICKRSFRITVHFKRPWVRCLNTCCRRIEKSIIVTRVGYLKKIMNV